VIAWLHGISADELFLSVLVLGELRQGVERLRTRDPLQAQQLDRWLLSLERQFAERVLPVTREIADAWGRLRARATLPPVDALLAATALIHGLTVASRDTGSFDVVGVPVVNPWTLGLDRGP
jgi:hypothetical protein